MCQIEFKSQKPLDLLHTSIIIRAQGKRLERGGFQKITWKDGSRLKNCVSYLKGQCVRFGCIYGGKADGKNKKQKADEQKHLTTTSKQPWHQSRNLKSNQFDFYHCWWMKIQPQLHTRVHPVSSARGFTLKLIGVFRWHLDRLKTLRTNAPMLFKMDVGRFNNWNFNDFSFTIEISKRKTQTA